MISWERHRRTRELSNALGIPLYEICHGGGRALRYLISAWRTAMLLLRTSPAVLVVQNPSVVLALAAVCLRPFFRYRLVVDAHNEAVRPYINQKWPVPAIARWLLRKADITIVTNEALARVVASAGGNPHVLPDCLPKPPPFSAPEKPTSQHFSVMVIATYADDEPILEIIDAARDVGSDYLFKFTGNDRKLSDDVKVNLPPNVELTGFLPEETYWSLMNSSDVVLDLTLMPDCLVCGAYEALSLDKPMILSESPAAKELFSDACLLTKPEAKAIAKAVRVARATSVEMNRAVPEVAVRFVTEWKRRAEALIEKLET